MNWKRPGLSAEGPYHKGFDTFAKARPHKLEGGNKVKIC